MIIRCCQMAHVKLNMRSFILINQDLILLWCNATVAVSVSVFANGNCLYILYC